MLSAPEPPAAAIRFGRMRGEFAFGARERPLQSVAAVRLCRTCRRFSSRRDRMDLQRCCFLATLVVLAAFRKPVSRPSAAINGSKLLYFRQWTQYT
jgi:hypothetical protein